MIILHIEHPVPDYDSWKRAFDNDPMDRKGSGVKSYKIFRQVDNLNAVTVQLEFDNLENGKKMLSKLQGLWKQVEGQIINGPRAKLFELVEDVHY